MATGIRIPREKAAWQAGLQSWGFRMEGTPSCGIPLFSVVMYVCTIQNQIPSNYICTCSWRNNFQLWLISVISVFVIDLTSFRYMTTGFRLRGQECRSLKAAPIICICTYGVHTSNHAPSDLKCLLEIKGRPKFDPLSWWSSISPNESQNFAKAECKGLWNVLEF